MNISDILLLPKKTYEKITGKRHTLVLGIVLVGVADMIFTLYDNYKRILVGKTPSVLYFNITLIVVMTILVGLIDVLFFSLPLFDLFKYFKMEKSINNAGEHLVRFMKVYIYANLLVVPVNTLFYIIFGSPSFTQSSYALMLGSLYLFIIPLWISSAVSRGANTIYGFIPPFRNMAFIAAYIWSTILSYVLGYMIDNWFMILFR